MQSHVHTVAPALFPQDVQFMVYLVKALSYNLCRKHSTVSQSEMKLLPFYMLSFSFDLGFRALFTQECYNAQITILQGVCLCFIVSARQRFDLVLDSTVKTSKRDINHIRLHSFRVNNNNNNNKPDPV